MALPPVAGDPYTWPWDGNWTPQNTALLIIDMQVDFCAPGGYVDKMGYDLSLVREPIKPISRVLEAARKAGMHIIHTREGHRPDLADLPANKKWRSKQIGACIGEKGPCGRVLTVGEPGWEIIPELAPMPGEPVVDKPGKGSFYATDLQLLLATAGVRNIILSGVTTDVCVHTTMRDANDRGYECLLLSDCTAATDPGNHAAALKMVKMQGGVFGSVADSTTLLAALDLPADGVPNGTPNGMPAAAELPERMATVPTAKPYAYDMPVGKTALIMIDFQRDFFLPGGFGDALGNDIELLKACVPGARTLLAACRGAGMTIVHTLEAHKPDLSDLHPAKARRGNPPPGRRIGDDSDMGRILVRNEPGNGIIEELAPAEGERALFKRAKGAFYDTDLEPWLRGKGVTHLLIAGVTTEVCVQTTMREANDRGFDCLLVSDATASYTPAFKDATLQMVVSQGGIVGWTADAAAVAAALAA